MSYTWIDNKFDYITIRTHCVAITSEKPRSNPTRQGVVVVLVACIGVMFTRSIFKVQILKYLYLINIKQSQSGGILYFHPLKSLNIQVNAGGIL